MILPINTDYRIRSDATQWIIEKRSVSKGEKHKGEEYWSPCGYYGSVESAVCALYDLQLRMSNAEGVMEATKEAQRIAAEIQDALSPKFKLAVGS